MIHENDLVKIVNPEGNLADLAEEIGKVERVYATLDCPIAVVTFEDGYYARAITVKVPLDNLEKVEIAPEIPEGAKQISRAEFKAALEKVTHPDNIFSERSGGGMSALVRGMTIMIVGNKVENAIFKDQDGVVMTEDEFISELWTACNPVTLSEGIDKGMSANRCFTVAIGAIIGLEEIVEILFGGSDD